MLPTPDLDDRRFQDLVDDAKRLIQQRCPAWSDHNVSDPGVTLIEACAAMVDQLVYRLNRVPDKVHRALLDLIGVGLQPPVAARADLTFWLSAPQPDVLTVPVGTEVASQRDDRSEPVTFSTAHDLAIIPCGYEAVATARAGGEVVDGTEQLRRDGLTCWSAQPVPGDALFVGLSEAVPCCLVALNVDAPVKGVGVRPDDVPWRWDAWDGNGWSPCEVESDSTGGLNRPGTVRLHVPSAHAASVLAGRRAGWLRCTVLAPRPPRDDDRGQEGYRESPRLVGLAASTIGGTVEALQAERVTMETLEPAEGVAGQRFALERRPVVAGVREPVLEVVDATGTTQWRLVDTFAGTGPRDRVFTLDPVAGEIVLAPEVRLADGSLRRYGAVPEKGATVRVREYWTGGGSRGNVAPGALSVLKSSLPFVREVRNRRAAAGGVDGETVAEARVRAPLELRSRGRAVTAEDFEHVARSADRNIARVRCLPATRREEAGGVRVLVVPRAKADASGRLEWPDLLPVRELMLRVEQALDAARVVGTRVSLEPAYYQAVTVVARVTAASGVPVEELRQAVLAALYGYVNPLTGGPTGGGWPFGRPLHVGDLFAVLQAVPGVEIVEDVKLFPADVESGQRGQPAQRIELQQSHLLFSYEHRVRVQEPAVTASA